MIFLDCSKANAAGVKRQNWLSVTSVFARCDAKNDDSDFKFGIFAEAFTSQVASSPFIEKYLYCLWWGLRNLRFDHRLNIFFFLNSVWLCLNLFVTVIRICSSYGQTLSTSTFIGETLFCIVLCIFGLILFAQLIGNMQVRMRIENQESTLMEMNVY